jgi:hypothetical protein
MQVSRREDPVYLTTGLRGPEDGIGQVRVLREPLDLQSIVNICLLTMTRAAVEPWGRSVHPETRRRLTCMLSKAVQAAAKRKDTFFFFATTTPPRFGSQTLSSYLTDRRLFGYDWPPERILDGLVKLDRGILGARNYMNRAITLTAGAGEAGLPPGVKKVFEFVKKNEPDSEHIYSCYRGTVPVVPHAVVP